VDVAAPEHRHVVRPEPFLAMSAVRGMILIKDAMPDIWMMVDSTTHDIMSQAVIMSG